ncbi:GntR family transcriptional regulator [Enterococcus sp. AZ109]|uniref:GntR family transcriptional regulator n=1 Tax=Enterococcus sp. AZ109 TaxID=2774634 RepID=UPI003F683371
MANNRSKQNPARYIKVYNSLLKNIREGLYAEEGKLPPENILAKQMDVSRMTLRQALSLLQEDGILESRKGVGTFIKQHASDKTDGLEYVGNVLKKAGITSFDTITCESRLDTAELYTDDIFQRQCPVLLGVTLRYFEKDTYLAESFSIFPTDIDLLKGKDLSDEKIVTELTTKLIYEEAKMAQYSIKIIPRSENIIEHSAVNTSSLVTLITEKLFGENGQVLCFTKYYLPIENTEITITGYHKPS